MRYCDNGASADGRISLEELRSVLKALGCWFTRHRSRMIMRKVDTEGTGRVEIDEIIPHLEKLLNINFRYTDY